MSIIDTLITDRTAADVLELNQLKDKGLAGMTAAELARWMAGLKGSYNPSTDMNRVSNAMQYLWTRIQSFGYTVPPISPKTNWAYTDVPTSAQLAHYLEDLQILRNAISVTADTPFLPETMERLSVEEANNIEQILVILEDLLTKLSSAYRHSGVTVSWMNGGLRL